MDSDFNSWQVSIYLFWIDNNNSDSYSKKLEIFFNEVL